MVTAESASEQERQLELYVQKNSEANSKVFDLNQKTMQTLERSANVYDTFEEAWANLENEKSKCDILNVEAQGVDEQARAQQHQAR